MSPEIVASWPVGCVTVYLKGNRSLVTKPDARCFKVLINVEIWQNLMYTTANDLASVFE